MQPARNMEGGCKDEQGRLPTGVIRIYLAISEINLESVSGGRAPV